MVNINSVQYSNDNDIVILKILIIKLFNNFSKKKRKYLNFYFNYFFRNGFKPVNRLKTWHSSQSSHIIIIIIIIIGLNQKLKSQPNFNENCMVWYQRSFYGTNLIKKKFPFLFFVCFTTFQIIEYCCWP